MSTEKLIEIHQINDFAQHEEIRRLNVQQTKKIDGQGESIDRLSFAMFGNPDDKDDIGTKAKVDEIYKLLIAGNTIKKFMAWLFGAIMAAMGAIYLIFKMYKDVK
jgi:hypothetical protein